MRILMFIDGLGSGGAQRQFAHLAGGLAARGHTVTVAVYNDQDHFAPLIRAAGVQIIRLPKPSRFSLRPVLAFAKLYRRRRAQVSIAFLRTPAIKAELARLVVPKMRIIAAERSAFWGGPLPIGLRLGQQLHRLAHFVTTNSSRQTAAMRTAFPALASRLVTVRNGIALPSTDVTPPPADGPLRLLAISSLMDYKNSIRLAEALAILRDERGLRPVVSWLGETFAGHPTYGAFAATCQRIEELGLTDQWRWLGVASDVAPILSANDALIHPSLIEGTSNAVCEAMAAGLPVLAGRIADHADMIETPKAGLLFDPREARSIADAISEFAALAPEARAAMGRRGRAVIQDRYSFERMIAAYETLARAAAHNERAIPARLAEQAQDIRPCAG